MKNENLLFLIFLILSSGNVFSQIEGVWQSEGYGHILDISGSTMDLSKNSF